ncbi:MAG: DUF1217 domain-containing protein [Beijerinckiaceae bacterium]
MLNATILYNSITRDYSQSLQTVAKEPTVDRQTTYFLANIGNIKTASQLVNNSNLYNYVMTAFGLSDMTNAKALITKVLEGGTGSKSFAQSLNDPRYLELAKAFNFKANGTSTTSNSSNMTTAVNNFYEQALENNTAQENQGAQMALYFKRMAPNITSPDSILADKTLLQVFETAYSLPNTMSLESISVQEREITSLLDISQLQNPTYLQNFLNRFTASYDAQNPTGGVSSTPANALLVTSPGISSSLLLSLANLKLGGS